MKKITLLLLVLFSVSIYSHAQTESNYRQTIFGTFLGNARLGSINYDRRLTPGTNFGLGFSVGLSGSYSHYGYKDITTGVPVVLNYLLGKGAHALELGIAATPEFRLKKSDTKTVGTPVGVKEKSVFFHSHFNIGYRLQPLKNKGLMINALWTPALNFEKGGYYDYKNKAALLNFGVGVGYSFK